MAHPDDYSTTIKDAFTSMVLLEAVQPYYVQQLSISINGSHAPITRDRVSSTLGEEAAIAWDALLCAVEGFHAAARRTGQGGQP
ncbi:hypothetical protein [Paracoccus kondratievae]|uniref:Uncharacterized protein n=1 Tax=Paracoccus kondratievae TaxID=135740 RepID=A0AAD3NXJ4_9RHOB|nr:hypothetical protein [Paracoccus kondratievae]AZV00232.1 hypothetical protein pkon1_p03 [Paracoccus phage vB_PkoS_Pkon1]GLK63516.1 hypothetical protein GCM10017635_09860 [Paracoccus kondratievae]